MNRHDIVNCELFQGEMRIVLIDSDGLMDGFVGLCDVYLGTQYLPLLMRMIMNRRLLLG